MKKIISLLVALTIFSSFHAAAAPLYSKTSEEIITDGVMLKNVQRFYGNYALNISLVTADLKNKNLSFELLKNSGGSDKTDTVMNLAKGEENTVAAINGDFFSHYKGNQSFSLGIEIKDSELLQSHINTDMAAGFLKENVLSLSYISFDAEITSPDGTKMPIAHINKPTDYYGAVLMYTPEFNGAVSPFLPEGITAITVIEDIVTAKGISMGGTIPIPENGYILAIDDNMTPFLDSKFNIGDYVKTEIRITPSASGVETAFGGGTLLLKDGQKTKVTHDVGGNNPRSVIGTNNDGTVIYMMSVDGRQSVSRGVTLSTLADICLEMGMVNAINLDGGGSTAMVGTTLENQSLHKFNSPSENRKVINALAITNNAERGEAIGVLCQAEAPSVLSGDSVKIKVTPYDKNYNAPSKVSGTVSWSVPDGKGYVKDNIYYPTGNGEVTVDAYYNGKKTDSFTVNVIGEVTGIVAEEKYDLTSSKEALLAGNIKVFDEHGNIAAVNDITLLNPSYNANLLQLSGGKVKMIRDGAAILTLSHSGAKRDIKIVSGDFDTDMAPPITTDSLNVKKSGGFTFDIFSSSKMDTLFDRLMYAHAMDILAKADVSSVVGGEKPAVLTPEIPPVIAGNYIERSFSHSKIVSLQLADSVVSRGTQWEKLSEVLNSSQKNVFIVLDKEPSFLTDIDRDAFYSMLSDAAKKKNIFVISSGGENFCRIEDGVRYFTVANVRDESSMVKSVGNSCYLTFNITDSGTVTYNFNKLFN